MRAESPRCNSPGHRPGINELAECVLKARVVIAQGIALGLTNSPECGLKARVVIAQGIALGYRVKSVLRAEGSR